MATKYGTTAIDEDGYIDKQEFDTPLEAFVAAEEAFGNGALQVTFDIIPDKEEANG